MCTYKLGRSTCKGDSGGPLLIKDPEIQNGRFDCLILIEDTHYVRDLYDQIKYNSAPMQVHTDRCCQLWALLRMRGVPGRLHKDQPCSPAMDWRGDCWGCR